VTISPPRIRRKDVPAYLLEKHGLPIAYTTLEKLATVGGGPAMQYAGRIPLYSTVELDRWAMERLGEPVASTAGR